MIRRLAQRLLFGLLIALSLASAAEAHASLVSVEPPDGAVVAAPPPEIVLDFSEAVSPLVARLIHPDGKSDIVQLVPDGTSRLRLPLDPGLARGSYVLSWRIVSEDGHPVAGASIFSVGAASGGVVLPAVDRGVRLGLWTTRLLGFIGLAFGIGGVLFATFFGGPRKIAHVALALGTSGLVGSVGFQGLDVLGASLTDLTTPAAWKAGLFATTYGWTAVLGLKAFLLAALAGPRRVVAVASLVLAAAAVAATGHAATAAPQALMRPAVFLHAAVLIAWLGALPPLGLMLHRRDAAALDALRRFSTLAPAGIALLLVTGIGLSIVQLGGVAPLYETAYGQVLCVKAALVGMVLCLALYNRQRLTRPALASEPVGIQALTRSIGLEILLLVAVLGVAGLWRFTPPPRIEATARALAAPAETRLTEGNVALSLAVSPGAAGPVAVSLFDLTRDGKTLVPLDVSVELVKPSFGIGPFQRQAAAEKDGLYRADGIILPMGGFWVVTVDVLVSDFETVQLRGLVDIRERAVPSP